MGVKEVKLQLSWQESTEVIPLNSKWWLEKGGMLLRVDTQTTPLAEVKVALTLVQSIHMPAKFIKSSSVFPVYISCVLHITMKWWSDINICGETKVGRLYYIENCVRIYFKQL